MSSKAVSRKSKQNLCYNAGGVLNAGHSEVTRREEADLSCEPNAQDVIINEVPGGRSCWKKLRPTPSSHSASEIWPFLGIVVSGNDKIQTMLRTVMLACLRVRVSLTTLLMCGTRPHRPGLRVPHPDGLCVNSWGNGAQ